MKQKEYDYVIIGGGPTGLTLAWCLSKYNYKVAIIDKNNSLGGCHRVVRVNGFFTEHGPRIYLDNYFLFKQILKEILKDKDKNLDILDFYDIFTPYNFNMTNIGGNIFAHLTFRELFVMFKNLVNLNDNYKKISMEDFLNKNNFSDKAKDYIDRLCRMTDGAGIDRYTLYSFLQIANQNMLYKIYQPKKPNDIGLFRYWEEALLKNNVDIFMNSSVTDIDITTTNNNNKISNIIIKNNNSNAIYEIKGKNFIFAIPLYNISQILQKSKNNLVKNSFGNFGEFVDFAEKTDYLQYIPVIFHFNKKINLKKIWGFPSTSWGIGFIVMSDYMDFEDERSQTVISTLITKNNKSDLTNKTPNETFNEEELKNEVFRQLKISFPNLPEPTYAILSQNYYDKDKKKWIPKDTAFIKTKLGFIDNNSKIFSNLYNCGSYNGYSEYGFTSIESTMINAMELLYKLEPRTKNEYKMRKITTIISIMEKIVLLIVVWFIYFLIIKICKNKK
jgi:hypothetical protein